jgi:hypothetical protein
MSIILINLASYYWYKKLSFTGVRNDILIADKVYKSRDVKVSNVEKEKIQQISAQKNHPLISH